MQQDKAALDALFVAGVEACQSRMFRVARVMLRSDADAEDAVSSAIVSAYAHLPSLRRPEALPGYLIRCVVNACHAQLRRRRRELVAEDLSPLSPVYSPETPLWMYLGRLPERLRLPLTLHYGENLSLEETGHERTGIDCADCRRTPENPRRL